jgi:catechol 2,3-dioxygenase-like lactoylglutathione lyase family enzyme
VRPRRVAWSLTHRRGRPSVRPEPLPLPLLDSVLVAGERSIGAKVVERLDHVYYWVADLDRSVRFYRDVLGLRLLQLHGASWAEFDAGGRPFALHGAVEGQPVSPGGATAVFSVLDLDAARAKLEERGVRFHHDGDVPGLARYALFHDPDGNTAQLIEYARPQAESGPGGA